MTEHHDDQRADHRLLRVLFVCTANICRSPYMELLARHLASAIALPALTIFIRLGKHRPALYRTCHLL